MTSMTDSPLKKQFISRDNHLNNSTPLKFNGSINSGGDVKLLNQLVNTSNKHELKILCRFQSWSVDHPIRAELWTYLTARFKRSRSDSEFDDEADSYDVFSPEAYLKLPSFVDPTYCRFLFLNSTGQKNVERVLWAIARDHPEITYSPTLYPIAALFMHYFDPKVTFNSISNMLEYAVSDSDGIGLLPLTKTHIAKDAYVLIKMTNKFGILPQRGFFNEQRRKLSRDHEIDVCFLEWMKWIFIGLPFDHLTRVMDCYLCEGRKFLFRIALALLILYKKKRKIRGSVESSSSRQSESDDELTLEKMINFCEQIPISPHELISVATKLSRFSRAKIEKQYKHAESDIKTYKIPSIQTSPFSPALRIRSLPSTPRKSDMISLDSTRIAISTRIAPKNFKCTIIDWHLFDILWDWLPERVIVKEPTVIFCSEEDGNSLKTFYSKTDEYEPTVLLIKTTNNEIFGAFCSAAWSLRLGVGKRGATSQYFGSGETFLFSLMPKANFYPWIAAKEYGGPSPPPEVPHSSQLFMAADNKMISVGSGNGVGLWIDEDLTRGKTEKCDTFNNKALCENGDFTCSIIEVIGFI